MRTREDIERLLRDNLDRTHAAHETAKQEFGTAFLELPSALQQPEESATLANAQQSNSVVFATLEVYGQAIRDYNGFVLDGKVPDWLNEKGTDEGKAASA